MNWFDGSIPDAIAEARLRNKIFLVYVEGQDAMSKQMTVTYNDPVVVEKLSPSKVVPLKLTANSQLFLQFTAIFPVLVIPASYFIGKNGQPIEITTGGMDSADFLKKVDSVFQIFFEESVSSPPEACSKDEPFEEASTLKVEEDNLNEVPSTSDTDSKEEKPPLEDRLERAKALIEIRRQEEMKKEQEKVQQEELERRSMGKAMQEAERQKKDMEMQDLLKSRAKEREEERMAREAVRAQIAQDRAERAARYQQSQEVEQAERERLTHVREEQDRAARNAAMCSNEARLQFRLPDGSFTTHSFTADSTLEEARHFIVVNVRPPFSDFTLCTTFPRRHFTESNYAESLRDLQLAPSAVLLILPAQAIVPSLGGHGGFLSNLFWMLVSPFTSFWRFVSSFFARPPAPSAPSQGPSSEAAHKRREGNFYKKEGNLFRINNQSDDDENNTWNGNSTQQM